ALLERLGASRRQRGEEGGGGDQPRRVVEALRDLLDLAADLVVASQEVDLVIRRDPPGQRYQRVARAICGHLASSAVPAFDVRAGVAEKSDRAQVQEHRLARGSGALDGRRRDPPPLQPGLT